MTNNEINDLIHNLKVHQMELEMQNEELRTIQLDLDESRDRYFELYDLAPVGYMIISEHGSIIESNLTASKELGVETRDLQNQKIISYICEEDRDLYYFYSQALFRTHSQQECELRMKRSDGNNFWCNLKSTLFFFKGKPTCRLIISDISYRKSIEQTLIESEEKFRLICTSMEQGLALFEMSEDQDFVHLDVNESYLELFDVTRDMVIGKSIRSTMHTIEEKWMSVLEKVVENQEPVHFENYYPLLEKYHGMYAYSPKKNQLALLISDNTERVNKQKEINYMNYHDHLTGLYNKRFFEEELKRLDTERNLPLGIVMGDVNGLKLVNDSFGHMIGDSLLKKVAEIIKQCCRADDIVARMSGDEFVVILPNSDIGETKRIIERIKKIADTETVESIQISISFGYDIKHSKDEDIVDVLKSAEDFMYRHKLYESANIKRKMIELILKTLFEKNKNESLHSQRVSDISEKIASAMHYSMEQIGAIRTAGLMHDIGKIGISESLLNGKHKPSKEEWKEIKRHSETGYRILSSSNEFSEIATYILELHERWDGQGYPKGLKEDEILAPSRVIAIADAFDAMTHVRTYKNKISKQEAITELIRCKNSQFDPEIVDTFIENVVNEL